MVLGNPLLGTDVTEHVQLLFVFSAHTFFYQAALWKQESLLVPRVTTSFD
jgi:hypothetical protein